MAEGTEDTYDLFVSYAAADRAWVEGYLLDALERAGVRCHSEAAFTLGVPRLLEFERAVGQSARTLLVLSPAYLAEGAAQFADLLAQSYGLETATWPVIPLFLQPVELPPRLAMLTALDGTDPAGWPVAVERLCAELQRAAPGPAPVPPCPYPGMVPFGEADSARFFGREREVQELLERLRLHPFLTVIGPSGSGKSSLVFAGLLPALRGSGLFGPGEWLVRSLRPGEAPLAALAEALDGDPADPGQAVEALLAAGPDTRRLLLVVDQLEELFTLSAAEEVEPFQRALLELAGVPECHVVLTVRADFYPDLMGAPLWEEIQAHRIEVLPLDEEGLREAIVRPAEDAGVFVETALVERLVADAGREPGVLPLVQETLVLLWERVERRFLPLRAYEALVLARSAYGGPERTGLQVAMASRADAALAGLSAGEQAIARRVFLRLVQFGEGRADTRRQQPVAALRVAGEEGGAFDRVLEHLAHSRLLTLSGEEGREGGVDIAHESLIGGWPTLQGWIGERREAEQARRRLEDKAAEWERLGRGGGGLLDEVELLEAERWLESPDAVDLGTGDALPALVRASRMARVEAEAQKRRTFRFRLGALGAIAVLVIVALGIGLWSAQRDAEKERRLAQQQEDAAATAQTLLDDAERERDRADLEAQNARDAQATTAAERDRADAQAKIALSRQLAAQSLGWLDEEHDLALLLSVEANRTADSFEARSSLLTGLQRYPSLLAFLHSTGDTVDSLAFSSDGALLAVGGFEGTVVLWDVAARRPVSQLSGHIGKVADLAFSPDDRLLASGSWNGKVFLWDVATGQPVGQPLDTGTIEVYGVAFSADGDVLAAGGFDRAIVRWEVDTLNPIDHTPADGVRWYSSVAFSPDGVVAASVREDGVIVLWDVASGQPAGEIASDHDASWGRASMAFSPDGQVLAAGGWDGSVILWDVATRQPLGDPLSLQSGGANSLAFSPGGEVLAAAGGGNTIALWDAVTLEALLQIEAAHKVGVNSLAFSPDGETLASGGGHAVLLWDASTDQPLGESLESGVGEVGVLAFSPDGRTLASGSCVALLWGICGQGDLRFLDVETRQPIGDPVAAETRGVLSLAYSQDGARVAAGCADGTIGIWDGVTHQPIGQPLTGHSFWVTSVAFSPDGETLASGGCTSEGIAEGGCNEGEIRLWDVASGQLLDQPLVAHSWAVEFLAFGPDGRTLVSSGGGDVLLWDVDAREPLGEPLVGSVVDVAFSPDGQTLTLFTGGAIIEWDLATGRTVERSLTGGYGYVISGVFSPDGRTIASSLGLDVVLWDVETAQPIGRPFTVRGEGVTSLVFRPDGQVLASGSRDGEIMLWDVDLESWLARACRMANRNLTQAEWEQFIGFDQSYRCTCPDLPPGEGALADACEE